MKNVWPADKVERRKVADLVPYARNARTHSDAQIDQLVASIQEWGWTAPVLIDPEGGIIAGHGRVMAANRMGLKEIPCMVADGWTEAQRRAYVIADNKLTENAGWDLETLRFEFGELKSEGFDLSLTGFDVGEIDGLTIDRTQGNVDEDDVPDVQENVVSKTGDIWLLGPYFECEDCGKQYPYEVGKDMLSCQCS